MIIADGGDGPVMPDTEVEFSVSRCGIATAGVDELNEREEALSGKGAGFGSLNGAFGPVPTKNYLDLDKFANLAPSEGKSSIVGHVLEIDTDEDGILDQSEALAIFHAEGCEAGSVTVTVSVGDVETTATITVVGPVASIVATASPASVACGERSTIEATAVDASGHAVSDHTAIEFVSNLGGTLGGGNSTLGSGGPINPNASTVGETVGGKVQVELLTSTKHTGNYDVVVTGTSGVFGKVSGTAPPVVAVVSVNCTSATTQSPSEPASGTLRAPNTGDGGLRD